jgi:dolichyl-phosphate beta-glucosyltransferase
MENVFLSVVIPCYNESENLGRGVLREVRKFLNSKTFAWEVIISDDGSTDDSRVMIKKEIDGWKNFRLIENKHGGKPSALRWGLVYAQGKYILFTDMDQSTPIEEFDKLYPYCKEYPVVIGSRGMKRKNFPIYRKIGAGVFIFFRKMLLLPEINDTQCGFKVFESKLIKNNLPKLEFFKKNKRVEGWQVTSYDVELLHILKKTGAGIKEVIVEWHDKDVSKSKGGSVSRYFRESKEMLMQIIRVKLNDFNGIYD